VKLTGMPNALAAPLYVEVEGFTAAGPSKPELQRARLLAQAPSQFPFAPPASMAETQAGEWDNQWIKLAGTVRDGRLERDSLILQIMGVGGRFRVEIPGITNDSLVRELVDAEVRVRGVCNNAFNARGQMIGVRLCTPNLAQVLVDKPAPADPFAALRQDITALLKHDPLGASRHRVLVRGVVTISRSPRLLCLRDNTGAAHVQLARPDPVREGDLIEVVGFPATVAGQAAPVLQDALFRPMGRGATLRPIQATLNQLRSGELDAELVRLAATYLDATPSSNQWTLRFRREQLLFDAVLERNATDAPLRLEPGSEVELTGVCLSMLDAQRRPGTFGVLLRTASDLKVLKTPPWWSLERTLATLSIAALLILAAMGWVWLLRRRVHTQTGVIQARAAREQTLESRYRDLFENATDMVCTLDLAGHLTSINPAGERILGCRLANGEMAQLADLVVPEDRPRLSGLLADRPASPEPASCELSLRTPTGRLVRLEFNSRPLLQDGQVKGLQAIARDTTERHALEEKLRQAAKMESVGRLAGGIAHDFNNILTVIGGNAALLLEEPGLDGSLRLALTEVSKASERAAKLTSQLLTFSRRQPMRLVPVDLNGVVADISRLLRRLLGEHVQLQVNYGPNPIVIAADQGMMEQVIMNLAVNSRDAIEARTGPAAPGRLVVTTAVVRFGSEDAPHPAPRRSGEFACLRVQDNGCGIDPKIMGSVFEPFYTTKDVGKGTGLGLATVYGIVQEHDGWIEVTSTVGQGSEFCIFLPLGNAGPAAAVETHLPPTRGGRETILLVEDEAAVRDLAERSLSRLGYRVLTAESGAQALKIWATHSAQVNLLLTDVVMPDGMSGFDLADHLHRAHPALRVIYTSGYGMEAAERRLRKGITLLPKPFSVRALSQAVRECLDGR
jgi:PAS domain S-box-containing protein